MLLESPHIIGGPDKGEGYIIHLMFKGEGEVSLVLCSE